MAITNFAEPINERFAIRINFTSGRFATSVYGNAVKLTLIDGQNLALYRNILEVTYSNAWNASRAKEDHHDGSQKKSWKSIETQKAFRFMKPDFVDQCCCGMGEGRRLEVLNALRRLYTEIRAVRYWT